MPRPPRVSCTSMFLVPPAPTAISAGLRSRLRRTREYLGRRADVVTQSARIRTNPLRPVRRIVGVRCPPDQTCDRCGPAVRAAYGVRRDGELYLCRRCANRFWPELSARGWTIWAVGEHAVPGEGNRDDR